MIEVRLYKGYIRNWRALCGELGITAEREQDCAGQLLCAAYEKWGGDMGEHLHGMFAFALYDTETKTLFCMRDHFGTKPFYYYITDNNELLYGTSVRGIMEHKDFVKRLNADMLQIYLSLTYPAGEDTFFAGIKKLMPGCCMIWRGGRLTVKRYFTPEFHPDESKSLEDWADEIHTAVQNIMPEVKTADETAWSFLSGGVDSAYVLAMSDAEMTGSCGYDDERFDESPLAKATADALGRGNTRCLITPEDYFAAVPYVMYNMEQPLADASAVAFAIACRETAKHTRLCYSGEGADEFFGGYNIYRNAEKYGDELKNFYAGNTNIMKEDEKKRILKSYNENVLPIDLAKRIYEETEGLDPLTKMSDVDIQIWLEGDIYLNVDKMSEAAGLEIRMPLTDRRVFDIASRMPPRFKVNAEQNKVAFRAAAAKVLPEEIAFRRKLGFIVPIRIWLADERYNADVRAKFNSEYAAEFFCIDEINAILDDYLGGNSDGWRKVWTIYTFLVWYEEYFVKR